MTRSFDLNVQAAIAQAGFAKGTNELYNTARQEYQPQALSHLRHAITSSGPLNVVEIGAGTGLFTRSLLAHPEWAAVHALWAVEPSEGMREVFAKYTSDPRVVLSEGTFDATNVEDDWADLIVIAQQAFHWCVDYEGAAAEFARVLKPGGVLSLIWNHEEREAAQWVDQFMERVEQAERAPRAPWEHWRTLFTTAPYTKYFNRPEEKIFKYDATGSLDMVVNRVLSMSRIVLLTDVEKEAVVKDVKSILQRGEGKVWIDQEKGTFAYPHWTQLVISKRI
ncbi:S-adenosyl-L-methionine-dependent methyltransferase [Mycena rosella]|uniref:S-adenosyl-L-methionine-dependent methyltransferase n=1 Tax=Mycena rosella TaxID=1033263 RepID=A0AAD7GGA5_MYCRO|nr:S-adenosyl-L-methionine-dependent methyltransferase [Mycena rosella]